ncbi:ABC transporter family substrate-binding protein [Georgenia halophila]|uniref:ABC transporter family substrate-binding protein n=1 Tax=Georgenia halophila TaxID=620889 RepID=A0ABP8L479_9MICO
MRTKKGAAILAASAAMALALGACGPGGDGGGNDDSGEGDGSSGGGSGAIEVNAHPREDLQDGGTLRLAGGEALPSQWNPLHVNGNQADWTDIRDLMSVRPWNYDAKGLPTPNESFLEDFNEEIVDGQHVITLTLNPDAVWNTGDPITWEDYQATLTVCDGSNQDISCVQTGPYEQIESVDQGEDEFQVVITFKSTFPDWESLLDDIVPAESVADTTTFEEGWLEYNADYFTGPFKIEEINQAQQIITLVPNSDIWWGPEPMLDEVQFHMIPAEAVAQAFQNGEIDAFEVGPNPNNYQVASKVANADIRQANGPDWRHITFNSKAGLIQELDVRQAIVKGLNREAIAASDLAGLPEEFIVALGNHVFVNGQEGYQDNTGEFAYDPEAARKQLEEAGWVLNEETGIRERDGEPLQVSFSVLTGIAVSENEGQLVQQQLGEIGIDVQLKQQDTATWGQALSNGDFQMIAFSWIGTPYPMYGISQIYGNPETNDSNYANLNNPELNELIAQIDVETDEEKRIEMANQADQMIWEEVHTLPLYQRPEIYATDNNLANYGAEGFSTTRPENWGFVAE